MTRIDPDDPKWTAYLLGELDDAERAAVEVELKNSEEARLLVEELQVAASVMKAELREAVAVEPLTAQRRRMILSAATSVRPSRWFKRRPVVWISGLATASIAAIAFILTVGPGVRRPENSPSAPPPTMAARATDREASEPAEMNDSQKAVAAIEAEQRGVTSMARAKRRFDQIELDRNAKEKQESTVPASSLADALQVRPSSPPANTVVAGGTVATDAIATIPAEEQNQNAQRGQASEGQLAIANSPSPQSLGISAAPATRNELEDARANSAKSTEVTAGAAFPPRRFAEQAFSSLSSNVDTSSYSNVRGYLNRNRLPPLNAVRIDEMVNHFTYDYAQPVGGNPIGVSVEAATAPWNAQHRLVRIGIQTRSAGTQREAPIVASNVTVEVEFNPAEVNAYRIVGYDTGLTQTKKPFKDRIKTGWNMSAGQSVTILYEIVPSTKGVTGPLTVRVGYIEASNESDKSLVLPFVDEGKTFAGSSTDFRFAAAVASFGMLLSDSPYKGTATIESVRVIAENSLGPDRDGSRREFLQLIRRASQIRQQKN